MLGAPQRPERSRTRGVFKARFTRPKTRFTRPKRRSFIDLSKCRKDVTNLGRIWVASMFPGFTGDFQAAADEDTFAMGA